MRSLDVFAVAIGQHERRTVSVAERAAVFRADADKFPPLRRVKMREKHGDFPAIVERIKGQIERFSHKLNPARSRANYPP